MPARYGEDRRDLDIRAVDALRMYLARHRPVHVEAEGTVVAV